MARLELLASLPIFSDLDAAEIAQVAELATERSFNRGEYIFREGEAGNRLYVILSGEVRISRMIPGAGEEALAVLSAGAMFGEMSVFDRSERSTDAIAHGSANLLTIGRPDLEMLFDFNHELAVKVLRAVVRLLCARLRSTNDSLRSVLAMSMF
jgi:CRP/FNR family transcriptional regulator, cyclic AMP receptor protein